MNSAFKKEFIDLLQKHVGDEASMDEVTRMAEDCVFLCGGTMAMVMTKLNESEGVPMLSDLMQDAAGLQFRQGWDDYLKMVKSRPSETIN